MWPTTAGEGLEFMVHMVILGYRLTGIGLACCCRLVGGPRFRVFILLEFSSLLAVEFV